MVTPNTLPLVSESTEIIDQRSRAMLDSMPMGATFWREDRTLLACNLAMAKLFDMENEEEFIQNFQSFLPELQPDGRNTREVMLENFAKALTEGKVVSEWEHCKADGTPMPCEITLIRIIIQEETSIVGYIKDLRELKASQKETQLAQARNQIMLDSLPLCANFWSKDFENLACNQAAVRLFDLENKQEYLDKFHQLSPEYQPDGRLSSVAAGLHIVEAFSEGLSKFEWMHQKLNGEPIPAEITLIRCTLDDEDFVVGYTQDLREIKASQKSAKLAEERTQLMLDTMPLCANFWSTDLQNLACNAEAARLFDLKDTQEYLDKFHLLSPEYQPSGTLSSVAAQAHITRAFNEGYDRFEWLHQKLNGEPIPAEITLIRSTLNEETVVMGYTQDLREIKASQEIVKQAEMRNQLMLDSFPMGANFWDADMQLVDCNLEVAKLYGFASKEEYRNNFTSVLPDVQPDGRPSIEVVAAWLQKAMTTGYERFEYMCIVPQTQEPLPVEVTVVRIIHEGRFGAISYVRDLREFKAMLKEIREAEEDLRKAKDLAEQSTKAKSEFLANMSHEIRTPMNGILGLLHLLKGTALQEGQKEYVEKTLFSANNLLRIINDILDFSKIEAGKLEIEATPFTLQHIFKEISNLYAVPIEDKGLTLELENSDSDVKVLLGDSLRLKQVLFNLISNAIKFTGQGKISLKVHMLSREAHAVSYQFSVRDTGIGLSKEHMDKLFSAFSQADSSVTRKYGGTGLGLAISKSIVEMMHGQMWVESQLGEGTTFFFTATFELSDESELTSFLEKENGQSLSAVTEGGHEHGHLLLVEDNEINQLIAEELLTSVGYTLEIANNGQEALDMLAKKDFDLVLMDIQMPIMDGLTASQEIRKLPQFAHLPIVAMSAHAMTGDKEISIANGMNDHITKPIVPEVLYSTLRYWLEQGKQQ